MTFRWQEAIHQCHNKGQAFVVATILTTAGSTPRDGGSKMVVTEKDGSLAGIISERDFLNIVGKHSKDWEDISVSDVMTKEVITANPEDTLEQVMSVMTQHHIRHIPVMGNNKIVGLLALGDIINALLDKSLFQNELLKRYIKDWPKEGQ